MADPFLKAAQSITKQMLSSPTISTAWQYWFASLGKLIGEKVDALLGASGKVPVITDKGGIKSGGVELPVGATGYLVDETTPQTLTHKTLPDATITDFTKAQHDHGSVAKGGAIIDGDLTKKGAVQLSNSYAGILQTKATTEKALSDGMAHVTQLVDANANVTVKSVNNTAGSGDYLAVTAGTTALPVVLVSADGTETAIGVLVAAKGDTQYFQAWGGSGQYKGARFAIYGRDHASVAGKAYLDFGGYDATGQIIFRHRLTSSFLTVFTMNYDGKLTLVEDVNTAAGKKYLVNGAQHTHVLSDLAATPRIVADTTTELTTDGVIICSKPTAMTVNLLAATGSGRVRIIKNIGAGTVTADGLNAETIDGDATQEILQYESLTLVDYAAGVWAII